MIISADPGDGRQFRFVPAAIRALADVGAEAVPGLCEGLGSPEPKSCAAAVDVLQEMGAAGRGARDSLLTALDDPNEWVRYFAIDARGYLGANGGPAAKRLAEFVAGRPQTPIEAFARRHAIEALGRIGPEARDAAGVLEKAAAEDPDPEIRSSASLALKQIEVERLARAARREASGEMRQWIKALQEDDVPAAIAAAEAVEAWVSRRACGVQPGLDAATCRSQPAAGRGRRDGASWGLPTPISGPRWKLRPRTKIRQSAAAAKALEVPRGKP